MTIAATPSSAAVSALAMLLEAAVNRTVSQSKSPNAQVEITSVVQYFLSFRYNHFRIPNLHQVLSIVGFFLSAWINIQLHSYH